MWTLALLTALLAADPVPVAGRPKDFSGAIGGPFVVTTTAEPTTVKVGEPITFTVRVTGPGDLSAMQRPDLERLESFARFTVENGPDRDLNPGREFQYVLRARTPHVWNISHIKFVYFNPAIALTDRGFQTTYSDDVRITVKPLQPSDVTVPDAVWAWIERARTEERSSFREWIDSVTGYSQQSQLIFFWLLPPLAGLACYWAWRHEPPRDSARQLALKRLKGQISDPPRQVAEIVREFLAARLIRDLRNLTAVEVETQLFHAEIAPDLGDCFGQLLHDCERARFGQDSESTDLLGRAQEAIKAWRIHQ